MIFHCCRLLIRDSWVTICGDNELPDYRQRCSALLEISEHQMSFCYCQNSKHWWNGPSGETAGPADWSVDIPCTTAGYDDCVPPGATGCLRLRRKIDYAGLPLLSNLGARTPFFCLGVSSLGLGGGGVEEGARARSWCLRCRAQDQVAQEPTPGILSCCRRDPSKAIHQGEARKISETVRTPKSI